MNLEDLYNEKKLTEPAKTKKEIKPKKIKKKDIPVLDIYTRELQYYEYDIVQDIKIYNGVLFDKRIEMQENIEFFKKISPSMLTPLHPSTLTARGEFTNMNFNEEEFIKTIEIPSIKFAKILKIGCNYGEVYCINPYHNHLILDMVNSVKKLNNENIKIGCSCNSLLNTNIVLNLSIIIDNDAEYFHKIFKKYIKDKLPTDKRYKKKKASEIIKNFTNIQNYKILTKSEIDELYITIDQFIINQTELQYCYSYLDNIVKLITVFTDYEGECTCEKYTIDNIPHDKNELVKKIKNINNRKIKKKKSKRKVQGTGKYFSSQISFEIYNTYNKKITKIKIFRTGCYQIPGVKQPDMSDLMEVIILLKDYLNSIRVSDEEQNKQNELKKIEIPYIISVMRNYTCRVIDLNITIILTKLEDVLHFEKSMKVGESFNKYLQFLEKIQLSSQSIHSVFKYCNIGFYQISEISLNGERYPGLLVKFLRAIPSKETKKITIKILSSGKINIDGCTSELEVYEIYYWLQYIFYKYYSEITYDSSKKIEEIISSDSDDYESIYDDGYNADNDE